MIGWVKLLGIAVIVIAASFCYNIYNLNTGASEIDGSINDKPVAELEYIVKFKPKAYSKITKVLNTELGHPEQIIQQSLIWDALPGNPVKSDQVTVILKHNVCTINWRNMEVFDKKTEARINALVLKLKSQIVKPK